MPIILKENSINFTNNFYKHHRQNGAAVIDIFHQAWFFNGALHNTKGPAFINGLDHFWYINGIEHTEKEFNTFINAKFEGVI